MRAIRRTLPIVLVASLGVLAACTKPAVYRHSYTCPDGYAFEVRYSDQSDAGDVAILADEAGELRLARSPAASGERYTNESTVFWSKGKEAMIMRGGKVVHDGCTTKA